MNSFNNNSLHRLGWHALASSWNKESMEWPTEIRERTSYFTLSWTDVNKTNSNSNITSIAFIGGRYILSGSGATASVLVLKDVFGESSWQNSPNLNIPREFMGAAICNGYVYVIGGGRVAMSCHREEMDTMERMPVSKLFNDIQNENAASWSLLSAKLSEPRWICSVVTVHDRFIVVLGGRNKHNEDVLSSVDIIDTMTPAASNGNPHLNNDEHHTIVTVSRGPPLSTPRYGLCNAAVLDDQIWVVGGKSDNRTISNTFECLQYGSLQTDNDSCRSIFSSAWNSRQELSLRNARCDHAVAAMGQILIVVGGRDDDDHKLNSVEMVDPERGVVLELPNTIHRLHLCTELLIPHQRFLVIGEEDDRSLHMESLPCVNLSLTQLKKYLQELRRQYLISSSDTSISEAQQEHISELLLQQSKVKSLYHSLLYFYLFHRGGHVAYLQQEEPVQQLKRSVPNKNNAIT